MKIKKFINEVLAEMKNVKWPSKRMIIGSTIAVIIISSLVAIYLSGADVLFKKALVYLIESF